MMKLRWLSGALLVGGIAVLSACGGSTEQTAAGDAMELPDVYRQNCLSCHGNQLQGGVGPSLQTIGDQLSADAIARVITDGRGGMPSYGKRLSEEEITTLSAWLAERKAAE